MIENRITFVIKLLLCLLLLASLGKVNASGINQDGELTDETNPPTSPPETTEPEPSEITPPASDPPTDEDSPSTTQITTITPSSKPLVKSNCSEYMYGCCSDGETPAFGPNQEGCRFKDSIIDVDDGPLVCSLPKESGSPTCVDYSLKWYYNSKMNKCLRLWYTGCKGNANRFETRHECQRQCITAKGREACGLPLVLTKKCPNSGPWYYFDASTGTCEKYRDGHCGENANQFDSLRSCEGQCLQTRSQCCLLPKKRGSCRGNQPRWYFDERYGRCLQFSYSGCDGNENNFESVDECKIECGQSHPLERCSLPKAEGHCKGHFPRYYYNSATQNCEEFIYTGCQGNKNRFIDKESCESLCDRKIIPAPTRRPFITQPTIRPTTRRTARPQTPSPITQAPIISTPLNLNPCLQSVDPGECPETVIPGYIQSFYYDSKERECKQFVWNGCGGNQNRFESLKECQETCSDGRVMAGEPQRPVIRAENANHVQVVTPGEELDSEDDLGNYYDPNNPISDDADFDEDDSK